MALAKLTSSDAGASSRNKINTAFDAIDAVTAGLAAANAERASQVGSLVNTTNGLLSTVSGLATQAALANETMLRGMADAGLSQTIGAVDASLTNLRGQVNALQNALAAEVSQRGQSDLSIGQTIDNLSDAINGIGTSLANLRAQVTDIGNAFNVEVTQRAQADLATGRTIENLSSAINNIGTSLANLRAQVTDIGNAFNVEQQQRSQNDLAVGLAIEGVSRALDSVAAELNRTGDRLLVAIGRIDALEAGRVEKAAYARDKLASDALIASQGAAIQTLGDALTRRRIEFLGRQDRPGLSPQAFTLAAVPAELSGQASSLAPLPSSMIIEGDNGAVARIVGSGIIAMRRPMPVEPSRTYRPRAVFQRRANPSDPSNDSVVFGVLWLDQRGNVLPSGSTTVIADEQTLTTAHGRRDVSCLFARAASPDATFQAPPRARYVRAFVRTYGPDAATDVEVLTVDDASEGAILAPETADTVQRVDALDSADLPARVTAIEQQLTAPTSLAFATRSDAVGGTIPESVLTVELRGRSASGDGGGALYVRTSSAPPGSDSFTNVGGAIFVRVTPSAELVASWLEAGFALYASRLPASEPEAAGRVYLNGGLVAVS